MIIWSRYFPKTLKRHILMFIQGYAVMRKKVGTRFLFSTNHKDIGMLYLFFGGFSGLLGTMISVVIRLELSGTGSMLLKSN